MASAFPRSVVPLDLASNRTAKLLRQLHPRRQQENYVTSGLGYDSSSGQVYREIVLPAAPNLALRQQEEEAEQRARIFTASAHGASSLYDMAMREVMANATGLTAEMWAALPWHIGQLIWQEAEALDLPRMSIWKAFVTAYGPEVLDSDELAYFRASEIRPQFSLEERLSHLESPTMAFIACLTISGVEFSRADIINISKLQNLGALDVSVSKRAAGIVDDGVIRNWGRRASDVTIRGFPSLQTLILRNQTDVTPQCFQHLSNFPALVLFGVQGYHGAFGGLREAIQHGWTTADEHNVLADLQHDINVGKTWDAPIRHYYEHAARLARCIDNQDAEQAAQTKQGKQTALLNFRIGPTSNEVLFSTTNDSLIFFRCTKRTHHSKESVEHPVHPRHEAAGSKKRKLRESRQIAAADILDGL